MPGAGQIRNSNGPMLAGLARQSGAEPLDLGIGRDEPAALRALCQRGLECDLLTVAGGVSAGVLDLVPSVLEALHVRCVFHRINLKPGKPLWFGVATHADTGRSTLVFGLPGNPVSSLVCFELFVRPAIARLAGRGEHAPALMPAQLDGDFHYRGGRVTMHPAALRRHGTTYLATPLTWRGSGDLRTLTEAQGLIRFAGEPRQYLAGDEVEVFLL
jgi:molybdopterin molybdotransferase